MKILGIVAEYNPFHLGHKYHIEESKRISQADYSLAIMSGSFVQRGEPALIDKFHRAQAALINGVDLVIELPFIYSCQTAEIFSQGAIQILDGLNSIDFLSFGSEYSDLKLLSKISEVLVLEPKDYISELRSWLSKGSSYPLARSLALKNYFKNRDNYIHENIETILAGSNNILAIEYLKELIRLDSQIQPITIRREGNQYLDKELGLKFSSATSIRENLLKDDFSSPSPFLPPSSLKLVEDFYKKYGAFNRLENYYYLLNYKLITKTQEELSHIFDLTPDLTNRFINNYPEHDNLESLVGKLTCKTYTRTRVQRGILNIILENYSHEYKNIINNKPNHIRILASNSKGFEIINKIKKESDTILINRFSDYKAYPELNKLMEFEKKATDLYYLGLLKKPNNDMDYKKSPYIKK